MGKNWDKVYPNSSKLAKISKNINPVYWLLKWKYLYIYNKLDSKLFIWGLRKVDLSPLFILFINLS